MSKIALAGAATGTATFTIESPATSTNRTLTLPDNTGTIVTQNSTPAFASTIGVGGATAAASGAGITFPATQSASSDANTLDDYEQGTFTPTAVGGTTAGTTTYAVQYGYYTKIGRLVNVTLLVGWSALTGTGNLRISGLPFNIANLTQNAPMGACLTSGLNWSGGTTIVSEGQPNTNYILLVGLVDDGSAVAQQCVNESADIRITLTYFSED